MWREYKLGELATFINGYAFKPSDWGTKGLPIIRIQNLTKSSSKEINYYNGTIDDKYVIDKGDILISWSASLGVYEWNEGKAVLNQHIFKVAFDKIEIDKKFFVYLIEKELENMIRNTHGSTMKHITKKRFDNLSVKLPPLQTQKKIVEVLDKAQELIDWRKEQIGLLDDLIQATFYDMFGDPVTNPKGWKKAKLGSLCDIYRGGSPRPIKDFLGGTIPWIKIGDATKGDDIYLFRTKEYIHEKGVKKSRLVKKGSLIFANCGVSLGFARIIEFDGCIHDGWLSLEKISARLDEIYLLKLLNCFTDYFRKTAPDGTQPNLNTKIMKEFEVIVPPIEIQSEYKLKLEKFTSQKQLMQNSLTELENNYNSLMQRAFKGELF